MNLDFDKIFGSAKWLLVVLVSFLSGVFVDDISDLRSNNRKQLSAEITEFNRSTVEAQPIFTEFSDIVSGRRVITEPDMDKLRSSLLKIRSEAEDIKSRVPSIDDKYSAVEVAILDVLTEAQKINTADKNAPFVHALGRLYSALSEFENFAVEESTSFFPIT